MQTSKFSPPELAAIARALDQRAAERGSEILGSQLGLLISQAIHPRKVRDVGGLREITESDLRELVQARAPRIGSADIAFEIRGSNSGSATSPPLIAPDTHREIAGGELWRFFSNPKILCQLAASSTGQVLLFAPDAAIPGAFSLLKRPTSEEYRTLARQFAEQQEEVRRGALLDSLNLTEFYNAWILALRSFRSAEVNLLRQWETLRSEFVAKRLHEALSYSGVEEVHAATIVGDARPSVSKRVLQVVSPKQFPLLRPPAALGTSRDVDEIDELRELLRSAIDLMSAAELREIRISAGVLHAAARRMRG